MLFPIRNLLQNTNALTKKLAFPYSAMPIYPWNSDECIRDRRGERFTNGKKKITFFFFVFSIFLKTFDGLFFF